MDGKTSENLVGFCETDSITEEALFQISTKKKIQPLGLEIKSSDGGANISEIKKGVAHCNTLAWSLDRADWKGSLRQGSRRWWSAW